MTVCPRQPETAAQIRRKIRSCQDQHTHTHTLHAHTHSACTGSYARQYFRLYAGHHREHAQTGGAVSLQQCCVVKVFVSFNLYSKRFMLTVFLCGNFVFRLKVKHRRYDTLDPYLSGFGFPADYMSVMQDTLLISERALDCLVPVSSAKQTAGRSLILNRLI